MVEVKFPDNMKRFPDPWSSVKSPYELKVISELVHWIPFSPLSAKLPLSLMSELFTNTKSDAETETCPYDESSIKDTLFEEINS